MKIHCRWLLPIAAAGFLITTASVVKATPYASEVTNNNGTIQFYLNESNATITVTRVSPHLTPRIAPRFVLRSHTC